MQIKTERKKKKTLPGLNRKAQKYGPNSPCPTLDEIEQIRNEKAAHYGFDPAIEGGSLTTAQLKKMVHEAEQGPFYTLEQGQQMIKKWREQRQNR